MLEPDFNCTWLQYYAVSVAVCAIRLRWVFCPFLRNLSKGDCFDGLYLEWWRSKKLYEIQKEEI